MSNDILHVFHHLFVKFSFLYYFFNNKVSTVHDFAQSETKCALFIDIQKAYDSVWRDDLMVKLKEKGITGRIWYWIRGFLTDRSAAITMSGDKGQSFDTAIGLPQGRLYRRFYSVSSSPIGM